MYYLRPGSVGNLERLLRDIHEAGPLHPSSDITSDVQRASRLDGCLDSQLAPALEYGAFGQLVVGSGLGAEVRLHFDALEPTAGG